MIEEKESILEQSRKSESRHIANVLPFSRVSIIHSCPQPDENALRQTACSTVVLAVPASIQDHRKIPEKYLQIGCCRILYHYV
jgi:hypothetical protein